MWPRFCAVQAASGSTSCGCATVAVAAEFPDWDSQPVAVTDAPPRRLRLGEPPARSPAGEHSTTSRSRIGGGGGGESRRQIVENLGAARGGGTPPTMTVPRISASQSRTDPVRTRARGKQPARCWPPNLVCAGPTGEPPASDVVTDSAPWISVRATSQRQLTKTVGGLDAQRSQERATWAR